MKLLLSAYACEPWSGSEPGSGFHALMVAASAHEVWVLTRGNNIPSLDEFFGNHPYRERVHLIGVDRSDFLLRLKKKLGIVGMHLYYDMWQREAGRRAIELDRSVGFDLVHHATFANYWTRVGAASIDKPLVWGPVGGAVNTPFRMLGQLGLSGLIIDMTRAAVRALVRVLVRLPHASVTLVQNRETARRVRREGEIHVLPNALSVAVEPDQAGSRRREVLMAARLIPWKGFLLGLEAFSRVRSEGVRMTVVGEGPDRTRLERRIRELGLENRVQLAGALSRDQLVERMSSAALFLHPAFREEAGWVVAESLNVGTPVVALDRGGPPVLIGLWPESGSAVVPTSSPKRTARALARAMDALLSDPPPVSERRVPSTVSYDAALLGAYRSAAEGIAQ